MRARWAGRNRRSWRISRWSALEKNDVVRLPVSADAPVVDEAKNHAVLNARNTGLDRGNYGLAGVTGIVDRVVYANVPDASPRYREIRAVPVSADARIVVEAKDEFSVPLKGGDFYRPIRVRSIIRRITDAKIAGTTGFEREIFAIPVSADSAIIFEAKDKFSGIIDPDDRDFAVAVRDIDGAIADANIAIAIRVRRESRSSRDRKRETE